MRPIFVSLLVCTSVACHHDDEAADPLTPVESRATGVVVGESAGAGAATLGVYATNELGLPVPVDRIGLTSGGTLDAETVSPDASGWAIATVTGVPARYPVTASIDGADGTGHASLTRVAPAQVGAPAWGVPLAPERLVLAGEGFLASSGPDLVWIGRSGLGSQPVGHLPDEVRGLEAANIDGDGVTDALTWDAHTLVLFRGRSGGGVYAAGSAFSTREEIRGATTRDVDGDGTTDLTLLTVAGGASTLSIYTGDGGWGFDLAAEIPLAYVALAVSAQDLDGDGRRELTVLTEDGLLRRYAHFEDGWGASGNFEFDVGLGEGSRLLPSGDLTADGIEDLVLAGPDADGEGDQAWIVDVGADSVVYRMFPGTEAHPLPSFIAAATGDLSGDGVEDVAIVTDTVLQVGFWNPSTRTFGVSTYTAVPAAGPVALGEFTGDDVADVLVGTSQLSVLTGVGTESPDAGAPWALAAPTTKVSDFSLALPPVLTDLDGDEIVDLTLVAATASGVQLQVYGGLAEDADSAEGFRSRGAVILSTTGTGRDLAVCGEDLYVSVAETSATYLHHYRLNTSGAPVAEASPVVVVGHLLACGPFLLGEVVVVSEDGGLEYVSGTTVDPEPGLEVTVFDVATLHVGEGTRLVVCETAGCSIGTGDFDGDGIDEMATADGQSLTVAFATGAETVFGAGVLSVTDADGDGFVDAVLADGPQVHVFRAVPGGLTPAWASYVWRPSLGPAGWGDLDGDRVPDLFLAGQDFDSTDAVDWTGTLIYTRAVPAG